MDSPCMAPRRLISLRKRPAYCVSCEGKMLESVAIVKPSVFKEAAQRKILRIQRSVGYFSFIFVVKILKKSDQSGRQL